MTPGQAALAEAARLEQARVYGTPCRERSAADRCADRTPARPALTAVPDLPEQRPARLPRHVGVAIEQAIARGDWTETEIAEAMSVDVDTVRAVRAHMDQVSA